MERIAELDAELLEGPLWHPDAGALFWFDIPSGRLFRQDWGRASTHVVATAGCIGGATLQTDGSLLLLGAACRLFRFDVGTGDLDEIAGPIDGESRFNDATADPAGRVLTGTVVRGDWQTGEPGRLWRIDTDGSRTILAEGYRCPNGMAANDDWSTLWITSSTEGRIYRFGYDVGTGGLGRRAVAHEAVGQTPDGMTRCVDGTLWSACFDRGVVQCIRPADGRVVHTIDTPADTITSCCFAGPDLDTLVMTGKRDVWRTVIQRGGEPVRGQPEQRSAVLLTTA